MSKETFDSLMNQEENNKINDPTGLFTLLKNIQNQACSHDYLCIEIGTIYGDFNQLKPKKVHIPTKEKEDIQLVIKPVIVVNNTINKTIIHRPAPKPPIVGSPPPKPKNKTKPPSIIEEGECEDDFFNSLSRTMRFTVNYDLNLTQ